MITIISQYPNRNNERDGMVQRIAAIDNLIKEKERRYLEISLRKNWKGEHILENGINVYRLNFFTYFFLIFKLLTSSDYIYVHSIYNSLRIFPFYYCLKNIITDLHGVVPDELRMYNEKNKSRIFEWIEKKVMHHSYKLIAVTETMENYYTQKYPFTKNKFLCISIFANKRAVPQNLRCRNGVVYSGGTQKWQCVDKMVELIKETSNMYDWVILTGNPTYFHNIENCQVVVKSVSPEEVVRYYENNTFGIILREDDIVNRVACPTKLVEYVQTGLIPVVLSPMIGDFYRYDYKYVIYEDFKNYKLPNQDDLNSMREYNFNVLKQIMDKTNQNINKLKKILAV